MKRLILWIGLLLVSQIAIACTPSAIAQNNLKWTHLSQSALPNLQNQLQQDYQRANSPVDVGRMRVLKIQQTSQKQPLYLIDTRVALEPNRINLNPTCGKAGCAIEGYIQTENQYQQVLAVYLDPYPPKGKPLIEPTESLQNGLPCLNFNQRQQTQMEVVQWCYNGQRYQFVSSQLQQQ